MNSLFTAMKTSELTQRIPYRCVKNNANNSEVHIKQVHEEHIKEVVSACSYITSTKLLNRFQCSLVLEVHFHGVVLNYGRDTFGIRGLHQKLLGKFVL
jgi:hypothetical protein